MQPRESHYVKVARMAYRLAQQVLLRYSYPKSPHHFTLLQLAACIYLLMLYLNLRYRDVEEWLLASDPVCRELELPRVPDQTTLPRTFRKLRWADLEKIKDQ